MSDYIKKLKDPRWQKRRLEIMSRDEFLCQICYSAHKTLNVHHMYYSPGLEPWEADEKHLVTLCEDCHEIQKNIDVKRMFADLCINNSTVIALGFLLKKIIPKHVNTPHATEQAIWTFMYDQLAEEFREGNASQEFKEFTGKYIKWKNG